MGFDIFVAGSGGFSYSRNDVMYGDEWDLNWMEQQLLSRIGVEGRPSMTDSATRQVVDAMSRIVQVHTLNNVITLLIANHGDGVLNIAVRHEHLLWPTTGGFRSIALSGEDGLLVTRELLRFLDQNDMSKWGPIIELIDVLTRFDAHYNGRGNYLLNVSFYD